MIGEDQMPVALGSPSNQPSRLFSVSLVALVCSAVRPRTALTHTLACLAGSFKELSFDICKEKCLKPHT